MARDRLAAIRAQQAAGEYSQQYSFPQQSQQQQQQPSSRSQYSSQQREEYYESPVDQGFSRQADDRRQPAPRQQQRQYDQQPQPQQHYDSYSHDRQEPQYAQQQSRSRSQSGGASSRSRPNNPPPISVPSNQYNQNVSAYGGWSPGSTVEPPRDFNPYEPQAYSPVTVQPVPAQPRSGDQRSQYTPVDPVRTRQRSLSGGRPSHAPDRYNQPPPPPIPTQAYPSHDPNRPELRGVPSYKTFEGERGDPDSYNEYKNSRSNLVEHRQEKKRSDESYEMQAPRKNSGANGARGGDSNSNAPKKKKKMVKKGDVQYEEMGQFFAEVSDLQDRLREANGSVVQIKEIHARILALPSAEDPQAVTLNQDLTQMTSSTRRQYNALKTRILALDSGNAALKVLIPAGQSMYNLTMSDVVIRQTQVSALKERFKSAIQNYAEVERDNRNKTRARMERQVKIVNPDLSKQEVDEVVRQAEEGGSNAVFSQALLQTDGRRGYAARGALREVESRAAALARIETTLIELAQLFSDMAVLVEEQDYQIVAIEQKAVEATQDLEKGLEHTQKAVVSARSARKKRWICFIIILVLLIVAAVVIVFEVVLPMIKKNNDKKNAAAAASSPAGSETTPATTPVSAAISPSPTSASVTTSPTPAARRY